jgi:hypothetical protein
MHDAPVPRLSVEALVARRARLDRQPWLHTALPATPCVSPPEGARDAHASAASPSVAGPRALPPARRVAAAAQRQAPAVSRAPRPTAHRRQPQRPARGVAPGAPRCPRAISTVPPTARSARPQAIKAAPLPRASGGQRPARIRPASWAVPPSWGATRTWAGVGPDATRARALAHCSRRCGPGASAPSAPWQPPGWPAITGPGLI